VSIFVGSGSIVPMLKRISAVKGRICPDLVLIASTHPARPP